MHDVNRVFVDFLERILGKGSEVQTRNSKTKRLMNLKATFTKAPLVSMRRTAWRNALREMEWFLSGSINIKDLHPKVHHWWEPWADEHGDILNNYGSQFRSFCGTLGHTDQIKYVIDTLKSHPYSRRNVITTWHTNDMVNPDTPITNCHGTVIQTFVEPKDNSVHMTMYQRSCDMLLGVPHNWIQYWAFLQWVSHRCNRNVGSFTWIGGDCHLYEDHFELAKEMSKEYDRRFADLHRLDVPNLIYTPTSKEFKHEDFSLDGKYDPILKKSAKMVV